MSRILVVTRHTPLPWDDGAGAYLFDLIEYLDRRGHQVHLAWLEPHEELKWRGAWLPPAEFRRRCRLHLPGALRIGGLQIFPSIYWLPFKARTMHRMKRLLTAAGLWSRSTPNPMPDGAGGTANPKQSASWMSPPTADETRHVSAVLKQVQPEVLIVNYPWLCPLFNLAEINGAGKLCVSVDVGWRRAELLAAQRGASNSELTADQEALWLRKADVVVAISEADALEFEKMAPERLILVAPKAFVPKGDGTRMNEGAKGCLFVGSGNSFNVEGLSWFLTQVWPEIQAACPETHLVVAGSIDRVISMRPLGVTFVGQVPDLTDVYRAAQVIVVPLLRATGMNIKLVEAAAHGCACVATTVALESVPFLRDAVAEARDADEFISHTVRLLSDPIERHRSGRSCRQITLEWLAPDRCYRSVANWLEARAA